MKRIVAKSNGKPVEMINGETVAVIVGPETKLFFKRYVALKKIGVIDAVDHAEKFSDLAGDDEAFSKQVAIIAEQTGVSRDVAIGGMLFIRANERMACFDPLTLPWLN